jgi:arylsulfatase A-like enzyme/Tfp pilus assembly protein PilF
VLSGARVSVRAVAAALLAVAALAAWLLAGRLRSRPPHLLLVTIDTLRADRVGAYGYAAAETPALDALARRGARFENAHSPVPITGPAHATILTGQYPPVHGVRDNVVFPLGSAHPTLATLLKQRGYRTGAFVGAIPVAAAYGFGLGFDTFDEDLTVTPIGAQGAERRADAVADRAIAWLSKPGDQPTFTWVHLYDPHVPYAPPPPYDTRFAGRLYDGEVAFADAQLGRILQALAATGRERDTVVAVMSDHGESLGDHGERTHAILIYESTLRVPLVVAGPGVPKGAVIASRVGLVDVLPTLLRQVGVEDPPALPGRDLRPALVGGRLPEEALYAESLFGRLNCRWAPLRAWTSGDWKLVVGAERQEELFDLTSDPGERTSVAAQQPQRVQQMHAALRAALRKMAPQGDAARPQAASPEQEERLRSLGYVGGGGGAGTLEERGLPDPRALVHVYERVQDAMAAQGPAIVGALRELTAIAAEDPGNPFAQMALGHLAYRDGRLGTAERAFASALALDPDRPGVRLPYGRLLREMGRLDESERQLRIAVEQTTADDLRTPLSLADTLHARGRTGDAERVVDGVLARAPGDAPALAAKARLLVEQGREADAVPLLEQAATGVELDDWVELAELYLGRGQATRARESAERALVRSPGHPWALAVAGHALVLEGKREAGVTLLRKALALRPKRPHVWLSLARGLAAAGDEAAAARCRRHADAALRA